MTESTKLKRRLNQVLRRYEEAHRLYSDHSIKRKPIEWGLITKRYHEARELLKSYLMKLVDTSIIHSTDTK